MKLTYDLNLELQQKLVMTPELIQAINILQFNTNELEEFVSEQMLTNPILEKKEELPQEIPYKIEDMNKYIEEYGSGGTYSRNLYSERQYGSEELNNIEAYTKKEISLEEHLMFQLQYCDLTEMERKLGRFLIESIDDNGYLTISNIQVSEILNIDIEIVNKLIDILKTFDPLGVCATSLADCIKRQLIQRGELSEIIEEILDNHLEDVAKNKIVYIAKKLDTCPSDIQVAVDLIKSCQPRPGRLFSSHETPQYIMPDVFVEKVEDSLIVNTNEGATPTLTISKYYSNLLKIEKDNKQLMEFLNERMNSAIRLIKSIDQRKSTIHKVSEAIVGNQKDFFIKGSKHLKTLTLKKIADEVGIHESTVSRSINGKYLQCEQGVFELRYFFSGGVETSSHDDTVSSNSVKTHIRELIDGEDVRKPLSDQKLVELLKEKNIEISRRTVAKYRDEMNIPSSSGRRRF